VSAQRYSTEQCEQSWSAILAPRTGNVRQELTLELADFLGLSVPEIEARLSDATKRFTTEWQERVTDPRDEKAVTRFYNESETELFDLARWHSEDPIHYRTLMCCDAALGRSGREYLDYGSGIGSDALIFGAAGFSVTLADVSEPLLAFAKWRCDQRGLSVRTIDLKRDELPADHFNAVVCFDVLEHIHRPLRTLRLIQRAMTPGGLLFVHAPFGADPDRPMHIVHEDVVSFRMQSLGFRRREDSESLLFPSWLWAPKIYESVPISSVDRVAYSIRDNWLNGPMGQRIASVYRQILPQRTTRSA
jgi:2-polyprenyl-3-methyl-5-hydroxy-6-metoxy-1,4-benzoquinol methylase